MKVWDWKRGDKNKKRSKHRWRTISLKKFTLVLQLKQLRKLYNCGPLRLFQFHFGIEVYVCYFFVPSWERRGERGIVEFWWQREKLTVGTDLGHQNKRFLWQIIHLIWGVHIMCFRILKVREKTDVSSSWFLISSWVQFLGRFFEFFKVMNEFVMVSRVFWVKTRLQNMFLGQKNNGPDFLVATVTEIWAKQVTCRLPR